MSDREKELFAWFQYLYACRRIIPNGALYPERYAVLDFETKRVRDTLEKLKRE